MKLVNNERKYWEFIRKLRNKNEGMIQQGHITKEQQEDFMAMNNDKFWVCIDNDKPVGYVGVRNNDLTIYVSKEHRRKGVAKFMLDNIPKTLGFVQIQVLANNEPSKKFFESMGYKPKMIIYN